MWAAKNVKGAHCANEKRRGRQILNSWKSEAVVASMALVNR